jgi:hypothetical protein
MAFKKALSALVLALPLVKGLVAKKGACSFLTPIVADLQQNLFLNNCGDGAHAALRLIFHDAIGFSKNPAIGGGGADGSIAVFNATELQFPGNLGVANDLGDVAPFLFKYANVLSPGDLIQLAGAASLSFCAGAPRVKFALGRPQPVAASPPNLIPQPQDSVDSILARMEDAGFSPRELIALLSSHSIAGADDIDPTIPGTPFDSTPSTFDTQIFVDVLVRGTLFPGDGPNLGEVESSIAGTLRLQSDFVLARDPRTACIWQSFVNHEERMREEFGAAVFKMSLLGQNEDDLIDCSEVIPQPPAFTGGPATIPPTFTHADIQVSCNREEFPNLKTQPGPALTVPPIPQASQPVA